MSKFLSERFGGMSAYVPGEQPQSGSYIKLNTNESPFPPSPIVTDAINQTETKRLNLYPDTDANAARSAIAAAFGVTPQSVTVGNGSDELLAYCFQAFCDSVTPAVYADITYGFYKVYARINCAPSRVIPLDADLRVEPRDYYSAGGTIFIANPNAPTGHALSTNDIEGVIDANPDSVVVVDEAYAAFSKCSAVELLSRHENLIVIQTMSKSRNLAGARLAYAISSPELIADLNLMRFSFNPYNVNRLSLLAVIAAFSDASYYERCVDEIIRVRTFTTSELLSRGFFVLPSSANFIFAKPNFLSGGKYYTELKSRGILVRHFDADRISDYVRITIGTESQMRTLIEVTDNIRG